MHWGTGSRTADCLKEHPHETSLWNPFDSGVYDLSGPNIGPKPRGTELRKMKCRNVAPCKYIEERKVVSWCTNFDGRTRIEIGRTIENRMRNRDRASQAATVTLLNYIIRTRYCRFRTVITVSYLKEGALEPELFLTRIKVNPVEIWMRGCILTHVESACNIQASELLPRCLCN